MENSNRINDEQTCFKQVPQRESHGGVCGVRRCQSLRRGEDGEEDDDDDGQARLSDSLQREARDVASSALLRQSRSASFAECC